MALQFQEVHCIRLLPQYQVALVFLVDHYYQQFHLFQQDHLFQVVLVLLLVLEYLVVRVFQSGPAFQRFR